MTRMILAVLITVSGTWSFAETAETTAQPESAPVELTVETPAAKKESEIPVQLKEHKEAASNASLSTRIWLGLAMILATGALSLVLIRKYRRGGRPTDQFQMKILSQHHLGPKKSLAVVRIAGESILIGVTDHHISLIKSLSLLDEDMPEETPHAFGSVLNKKASRDPIEDSIDSFSLSSIQDVVSRKVKGLRSLT